MQRDDPLFDPWGTPEAPEPPADSPSRAHPSGEADADGTPERSGRWAPRPAETPMAPPRPAPRPIGEHSVRPEQPRAEEGEPASREAHALRTRILPALHALAEHLRAERHEAIVDDRTAGDQPSVRFQIRPRPGPFDAPDRTHPALEIVPSAAGDGLAVRTWPSPAAPDPLSEQSLSLDAPDARIRRLLLDFVELVFGLG